MGDALAPVVVGIELLAETDGLAALVLAETVAVILEQRERLGKVCFGSGCT